MQILVVDDEPLGCDAVKMMLTFEGHLVKTANNESHEPGKTGWPYNSGRAELGSQNTTIGGLVSKAMKPTGRALVSDHRGRERVAALSVRTGRNRRTRTRMSGGVGGGGSNPPAAPCRPISNLLSWCLP
jgi:hypothetical protein